MHRRRRGSSLAALIATVGALSIAALSAPAQTSPALESADVSVRTSKALARIAADESDFNAWITVDSTVTTVYATVDKAAGTLPTDSDRDQPSARGLLLAVKDNIDVAGLPSTAGARALAARVPARDAFAVRQLRAAGAIVVGKTNLDTYARGVRSVSELGGSTGNAWNPKRSPGGSSGGTAVAVARGQVDAGLGTDTCGSARYPAVYNGVYGLRPSSGLVSRSGVIPLAPSQDVVGPIARTPQLLAEVLQVIAVPDSDDPSTLTVPREPLDPAQVTAAIPAARIGVIRSLGAFAKSSDGATVLDTLRASGTTLVDVTLPQIPNANLIADEFSPALKQFLAEPEGKWLDRPLQVRDRSGYARRKQSQSIARQRLIEMLDKYKLDGLIYPTTQYASAPRGASQPSANCYLAATSGLPAIALPHRLASDGLPAVGADVLGRPYSEMRLLQIAARYDKFAGLTFPAPPL